MGLQKPSNHVMAGKATIHSLDCEDDDVEASSATEIDDGDDVEHISVSLGVEEHISVPLVNEKHISVSLGAEEHISVSLGGVEHISVNLGVDGYISVSLGVTGS